MRFIQYTHKVYILIAAVVDYEITLMAVQLRRLLFVTGAHIMSNNRAIVFVLEGRF